MFKKFTKMQAKLNEQEKLAQEIEKKLEKMGY